MIVLRWIELLTIVDVYDGIFKDYYESTTMYDIDNFATWKRRA